MTVTNAGELTADREVVQLFRATEDELAFVSPVIPTFARQNSGTLQVALHRMPRGFSEAKLSRPPGPAGGWRGFFGFGGTPPQAGPVALGTQLARREFPCANLVDSEAVDLPVGPAKIRRGEILALCIRTDNREPGISPTLWLTDKGSEGRIPGHIACFAGQERQNRLGLQAGLLYGGLVVKSQGPRMLFYSPVTQCNLNCIHCISAHTRNKVTRISPQIKAEMKKWSKAGQLEVLASDYSGDILWADSRFGGELDFITGLEIPIHIDTNGVCLTREVSERLCRSRIDAINISLDAARDETFRRVRKGAPPLAEVTANIAGLVRARAEAQAKFKITMSFTLMRSNLAEWPDFVRMAAALGVDAVHSRHLEAYTAEMEPDSLWHDRPGYNAARQEIEALAAMLGFTVLSPVPFGETTQAGHRVCSVPWHSAGIIGNGDVVACCVPGLVMGNLASNSMAEIWNGPAYRKLRSTVNSENPPPPCAACPIFRRTDNPDSYLIHSAIRRMRESGQNDRDAFARQP